MAAFFVLAKRQSDDAEWVSDFTTQYATGVLAQAEAKRQNAQSERYGYSHRYRVRKVVDTDDDNFYAREAAKNHAPLPWKRSAYFARWNTHMLPHIDPEHSDQIRFFENIADAVECKYTSMKMNRFLNRYEDFGEEKNCEILVECGFYDKNSLFGITTDANMIVDIYENGPTSCMNDPEEYSLPDPHPVTVYSKGDLALAYIGSASGSGYSSRAVVYPEKKLYYTIYGHSALMRKHLDEAGYVKCQNDGRGFSGAKVAAIQVDGQWLMPYVDACGYAHLDADNEHFILDYDDGRFEVRTTEGYAYEEY